MVYTVDPILIAAAVIPAIILLIKVERADRLEKESRGLLVSLVLFGIASTAIASLLERVGMTILDNAFENESTLYNILLYFGVVAFAEEGAKYVLLKRRTWRNPEGEYRLCCHVRLVDCRDPGGDGGTRSRVLRRIHGHVVWYGQAARGRGGLRRSQTHAHACAADPGPAARLL